MKQLYFVVLQLYLFKEWFFETVLEITFTRYVYLPSSEKMLLFSKTNGCVRVFSDEISNYIYIKTFIYHEATSELFLAKRKSNSKVCAAS